MKRKGFTLVELLAVIVILAVIALIAIPVVNQLIKQARQQSAKVGATAYINMFEDALIKDVTLGKTVENGRYSIIGRSYSINGITRELEAKGTLPSNGAICVDSKGKVTTYTLKVNDYIVSNINGSQEILKEENYTMLCDLNAVIINITASPKETSESKTITITGEAEGAKLQYQLGSTSNKWIDYNEPFTIVENTTIYARLYDGEKVLGTANLTVTSIKEKATTIYYNHEVYTNGEDITVQEAIDELYSKLKG